MSLLGLKIVRRKLCDLDIETLIWFCVEYGYRFHGLGFLGDESLVELF